MKGAPDAPTGRVVAGNRHAISESVYVLPLPCQVQMQASLPSGSARTQNARAASSEMSVPPAASAAATRDWATSCGTVTSMWIRLRCGPGRPSAETRTPGLGRRDRRTRRRDPGCSRAPPPRTASRSDVERVDHDSSWFTMVRSAVIASSTAIAEIVRARPTSRVVRPWASWVVRSTWTRG